MKSHHVGKLIHCGQLANIFGHRRWRRTLERARNRLRLNRLLWRDWLRLRCERLLRHLHRWWRTGRHSGHLPSVRHHGIALRRHSLREHSRHSPPCPRRISRHRLWHSWHRHLHGVAGHRHVDAWHSRQGCIWGLLLRVSRHHLRRHHGWLHHGWLHHLRLHGHGRTCSLSRRWLGRGNRLLRIGLLIKVRCGLSGIRGRLRIRRELPRHFGICLGIF